MEWNLFCLYLTLFLFHHHTPHLPAALATLHPVLASFLCLVSFAIPVQCRATHGPLPRRAPSTRCAAEPMHRVWLQVYGQLWPQRVPFLTAYRPYAGNWRFSWHILDAKAAHKLRKLKTLEGPFASENARTMWSENPHICDQMEDYFTGNLVFFPHFRPLIPVVEKLRELRGWKGHHDCITLAQETFFNAVFGWCLGTGFYARGAYFEALSTTCGFAPNECYYAVFEPQGLLDHTAEWHVVDVTNPSRKIIHGKVPYAELEKFQPSEMSLEMLERCSILGDKKKAA